MEVTFAWIGLMLVGILFRQVLRFQEVLEELSRVMALGEHLGVPAINYQNSMTPRWLTNTWIALAFAVLTLLIGAGYFGGIVGAIVGFVLFVAAMLVSGLCSRRLGWPRPGTYYRVTFHVLANREANYRRGGDLDRADAAKHFRSLLTKYVGNSIFEKTE